MLPQNFFQCILNVEFHCAYILFVYSACEDKIINCDIHKANGGCLDANGNHDAWRTSCVNTCDYCLDPRYNPGFETGCLIIIIDFGIKIYDAYYIDLYITQRSIYGNSIPSFVKILKCWQILDFIWRLLDRLNVIMEQPLVNLIVKVLWEVLRQLLNNSLKEVCKSDLVALVVMVVGARFP